MVVLVDLIEDQIGHLIEIIHPAGDGIRLGLEVKEPGAVGVELLLESLHFGSRRRQIVEPLRLRLDRLGKHFASDDRLLHGLG